MLVAYPKYKAVGMSSGARKDFDHAGLVMYV